MNRIYLSLLLAAPLLSHSPAFAATRVERGNLTFENIPQAAPELEIGRASCRERVLMPV